MKKMFILTLIFFVSCHVKEIEKFSRYYSYDFTNYTKNGFLITPESYNGEYESIALIMVEVFPEVRRKSQQDDPKNKSYENYLLGDISTKEVIDSLYYRALRKGADAIINFNTNHNVFYMNGSLKVNGIAASGYAIKRKR